MGTNAVRGNGGRVMVGFLVLAGCAGPAAVGPAAVGPAAKAPADGEKGGAQPKNEIVIDDAIAGDGSLGAAWMIYGLSLGALRSKAMEAGEPIDRFGEEVEARSHLAEYWGGASAKPGKNEYLDALARVGHAGFMSEYVAVFLAEPGFELSAAQAGALRLGAFVKWMRDNHLGKHHGETHAGIHMEGHDLPPPLGDKVTEAFEIHEVGDCKRLGAKLDLAAAHWADKLKASKPMPLIARSREEFLTSLLDERLRAGIARRGVVWASPDLRSLLMTAGFCANDNQDFNAAEHHFTALLAANPADEGAIMELSHTYLNQKRWDDADKLIADLSERVTDECHKAILLRKRGYILVERGLFKEARTAYVNSLELDPNNETAFGEIRLIDQQLGVDPNKDSALVKRSDKSPTSRKTEQSGVLKQVRTNCGEAK